MAQAKKKKQAELKNRWAYTIGPYETEICGTFASEDAAIKAAKEELRDNYMDYDSEDQTICIWEAVRAIAVELEIKEVEVKNYRKEVKVKEVAANVK